MAKTIVGHLNAAHAFLQAASGRVVPIYQGLGKSAKLIPLLGDTIALRQKWQQPQPKREPLTWELLKAFHQAVKKQCKQDPFAALDRLAATFDWTRLGCFTGSRAGEYAQTVAKRGDYSKAPFSSAAGQWQGQPVAFIEEDFVLLDCRSHVIPTTMSTLREGNRLIKELHIRFRFDKSPQNFTIRKFTRGSGFLCPIDAIVSILIRAKILGVPKREPLGVFRISPAGRYTYIRSQDIIDDIRTACELAYPDPSHFLRVNISRLVAHSNRVTAAVALYNAGFSIEKIADRLRWSPVSVKHYIRECSQAVGKLTEATIVGAIIL
jgi:hypothetical protein